MITDAFDDDRNALITPQDALSEKITSFAKAFPIETFIMVFSKRLMDALLEENRIEILHPDLALGTAAYKYPVCRVTGTDTGFILSGVGAPAAAGAVEELNALFPLKHLILYGSCGTLIDLPEGTLIIPALAYRDEGTSYHYAPASDWIPIPNAGKLEALFQTTGIETVTGNTWTTDGFYRETETKKAYFVKQGCVCVEMECASIQAVCDYRGIEFYPFFYGADSLHGASWARRILGDKSMSTTRVCFEAAVKIADLL